jgi:hypothetical protein
MKGGDVRILASVIIAFSTFIGVAGAIAFYMVQIRVFTLAQIVLTEIIYMLLALVILLGVKITLE